MSHVTIRRGAAGFLGATGALHLILAPEYLGEKAYIGVLFILGGIAALAIAARLWRTSDRLAWTLGAAAAAGMAVAFVLSRSVGLPGFHPHDWEPSGILSVLIELGFLAAWAVHELRAAPRAGSQAGWRTERA
jgi:hypothetical protein